MRTTEQAIKEALDRMAAKNKPFDTTGYNPAFIEALKNAIDKNAQLNKGSKASSERLTRAIASGYRKSNFTGKLALAESIHPLQRTIELTLLPLNVPNANRQAIPASEAENIRKSAQYMPIRVFFDGEEILGHAGAKEVGVLGEAWLQDDEIKARGVIWAEYNSSFIEYLEKNKSVGSSFEIYYGSSKVINGVEFLYDTVFAAQAIVSNPAYGTRTGVKLT